MSTHLEKTRTVETKNFGDVEIRYRIWQAETPEERNEKFGGEAEVTARMNGVFLRGAEAKGIRLITDSEAATQEDLQTVITKAVTAMLDYKPEATTGDSKAAKVEKFDALTTLQSKVDFTKIPAAVVMQYLQTNDESLLTPYMN